MNLFYQPRIPDGVFYLDTDESRHCIKVLRKKEGDSIRITDGKGFFYEAFITTADTHQCRFKISESIAEPRKDYSIHIAISPTKNADRIEWFIEKAVELGIDTITLLECQHTERTYSKIERLEKVAISAMKQSLKATLPVLNERMDFSRFVSGNIPTAKFIAYVDQTNPHHLKDLANPGMDYLVLIGPEGDFSAEELALALHHGFQKVSLGTSRLRTETAGLAACHTLNLINTSQP